MKTRTFSGWAFPESALEPIATAIRAVNRDGEVWIGWSLGGLRALTQCDAVQPRALILISSTARFCADGDSWPGLPRANLRALQRQLERAPDEALRGFHRLCTRTADDAAIEERIRQSRALPLADGLRALDTLDLRPRLNAITQPVLLLHGAQDRVIPAAAARAMAAAFPNAQLCERADAAHDLPLAHREWTIDRAYAFLEQLS